MTEKTQQKLVKTLMFVSHHTRQVSSQASPVYSKIHADMANPLSDLNFFGKMQRFYLLP